MKPNDVLDGRYELLRRIGVGGMGSVWEARERPTGRRVAIKALHEHLVEETEIVTRFLREAQAALESRYSGHIIEVYDVVQSPGRPPYIVMEFLEGEDLEQILEREGPFDPRRAVDLIIQTCEAVAEVHRQGLIHRDIKPENLFVTRLADGTEWIKLLDFGVVKFSDSSDERGRPLTDFGRTVGTIWYMAPEQAADPTTIDERVDVYATGVVLYELLTGSVPFDSDDHREVMRLVYKGGATALRKHRPEISEGLEKVVHRAMASSRRKRFPSIYAFAEALEPFTSKADDSALQDGVMLVPQPPPTPRLIDAILGDRAGETVELDGTVRRRRPSVKVLLGAGALVVVLLGGLLFALTRSCEPTRQEDKEEGPEQIIGIGADADDLDGGDETGDGGVDTESSRERWQERYGKRLDRRAVARGLRAVNPSVRRCLSGARAPGSRVLVHFWIASDGTILYRRSRPSVPRSAENCIRRAVRSKRMAPTKVPPFVATQAYVVPR